MVRANPANSVNTRKADASEPIPFKVSGLQLSDDDGSGMPGNTLNPTQKAGMPGPDKPALDKG